MLQHLIRLPASFATVIIVSLAFVVPQERRIRRWHTCVPSLLLVFFCVSVSVSMPVRAQPGSTTASPTRILPCGTVLDHARPLRFTVDATHPSLGMQPAQQPSSSDNETLLECLFSGSGAVVIDVVTCSNALAPSAPLSVDVHGVTFSGPSLLALVFHDDGSCDVVQHNQVRVDVSLRGISLMSNSMLAMKGGTTDLTTITIVDLRVKVTSERSALLDRVGFPLAGVAFRPLIGVYLAPPGQGKALRGRVEIRDSVVTAMYMQGTKGDSLAVWFRASAILMNGTNSGIFFSNSTLASKSPRSTGAMIHYGLQMTSSDEMLFLNGARLAIVDCHISAIRTSSSENTAMCGVRMYSSSPVLFENGASMLILRTTVVVSGMTKTSDGLMFAQWNFAFNRMSSFSVVNSSLDVSARWYPTFASGIRYGGGHRVKLAVSNTSLYMVRNLTMIFRSCGSHCIPVTMYKNALWSISGNSVTHFDGVDIRKESCAHGAGCTTSTVDELLRNFGAGYPNRMVVEDAGSRLVIQNANLALLRKSVLFRVVKNAFLPWNVSADEPIPVTFVGRCNKNMLGLMQEGGASNLDPRQVNILNCSMPDNRCDVDVACYGPQAVRSSSVVVSSSSSSPSSSACECMCKDGSTQRTALMPLSLPCGPVIPDPSVPWSDNEERVGSVATPSASYSPSKTVTPQLSPSVTGTDSVEPLTSVSDEFSSTHSRTPPSTASRLSHSRTVSEALLGRATPTMTVPRPAVPVTKRVEAVRIVSRTVSATIDTSAIAAGASSAAAAADPTGVMDVQQAFVARDTAIACLMGDDNVRGASRVVAPMGDSVRRDAALGAAALVLLCGGFHAVVLGCVWVGRGRRRGGQQQSNKNSSWLPAKTLATVRFPSLTFVVLSLLVQGLALEGMRSAGDNGSSRTTGAFALLLAAALPLSVQIVASGVSPNADYHTFSDSTLFKSPRNVFADDDDDESEDSSEERRSTLGRQIGRWVLPRGFWHVRDTPIARASYSAFAAMVHGPSGAERFAAVRILQAIAVGCASGAPLPCASRMPLLGCVLLLSAAASLWLQRARRVPVLAVFEALGSAISGAVCFSDRLAHSTDAATRAVEGGTMVVIVLSTIGRVGGGYLWIQERRKWRKEELRSIAAHDASVALLAVPDASAGADGTSEEQQQPHGQSEEHATKSTGKSEKQQRGRQQNRRSNPLADNSKILPDAAAATSP